MPINIYESETVKELAYLAEDDWGLPSQLYILEEWLAQNEKFIKSGDYVADIGFIADNEPGGGGGSFSCKAMKKASDLGIHLFFSEYPD